MDTYAPEPTNELTLEYLLRELNKLSAVVGQLTADVLNVAPTRPQPGDIRAADGTNWDPGSGVGFYGYINGGWTFFGGSGGGGAPVGAKYIVQQADGTLTNEQALGALATGLLKNTTGTGVLSIAVAGTDYLVGNQTITLSGDASGSGATSITVTIPTFAGSAKGLVPVSLGGTTNFLRADGAWAAPPSGSGGDLGLDKHILSSGFTVTADYAAYVTRYLEVAAGVNLEIGAGGDLEIG